MVGWHHQLNRCEFEPTPGDSEGQGSLACCSPCSISPCRVRHNLATEQQQIMSLSYIFSLVMVKSNNTQPLKYAKQLMVIIALVIVVVK